MTETISALQNILESLSEIQKSAWFAVEEKWKPSRQALKTYNAVSRGWEPITFEQIAYLFNRNELVLNFCNRVLYLPPLEKDPHFVPVLSLSCKLNESRSVTKLRVMLVCLDDCFEENRKVYGVGFRMETPHSQDQNVDTSANEGVHDFHHAQLIREFGQTQLDCNIPIDCPYWLPQSQPSFPLPAKCPVTLLLCLIVTLYGRKYYNQFVNDWLNNYRRSDIERYKEELDPWVNWKRD